MRVLITGRNSYIGVKTAKWLFEHEGEFEVDFLDMKSNLWQNFDMSDYDSVINAAGIVHIDSKDENLYKRVNTELAYECARKAKEAGVGQFIQISTLSVFAFDNGIGGENRIYEGLQECPKTYYGQSKLEAERLLTELNDESFKVCIVRTPMVYGAGAKGNYTRLSKLVMKLPLFPRINNQRSMIYVDNLTEFFRLLLINNEKGVFYPQNCEYVNTGKMAEAIALANNKTIKTTALFNPLIKIFAKGKGKLATTLSKLFGSCMVDKSLSEYKENYNVVDFETSIKYSER